MRIGGALRALGMGMAGLSLAAVASSSMAQQITLRDLANTRAVPSRVVEAIDNSRVVTLRGNVHPMAKAAFDEGEASLSEPLNRMVLVLQRGEAEQARLDTLNQEQYDPKSPLFHHWLHADEIGQMFGPSQDDLDKVTAWLQSEGFTVDAVSKGRVTVEFSGTVAQVNAAFHTSMHRYLVEGATHLANSQDPAIPEALAPVVAGVFSLNDFRHVHQGRRGDYIRRDLHTGKMTRLPHDLVLSGNAPATNLRPNGASTTPGPKPQLGYTDDNGNTVEDLAPFDVATIYNILPLWQKGITGNGVPLAIIGVSDIDLTDVSTFRQTFGLPAGNIQQIVNGADPGKNDGQGENTEDVEMASSTAPGATIYLVVSGDTSTTGGDVLSAMYIIDHEVAPIASGSYGQCELALGTSGNKMYNQLWQQAATSGISVFMSSGDQGSAGCNSQNAQTPNADETGLQVNGLASSPYLTAVGGTDLQWPFTESTTPITNYWNTSNNASTGASAKGYMPEMTWNSTCTNPLLLNVYADSNGSRFPNTEALCQEAINEEPDLVKISAGSGGVSHCTTPSGSTPGTCSGGYAKPSWQTGPGVPSDGKRDLPDVSMFASYGFSRSSTGIPSSTLLICQKSSSPNTSCDYSDPDQIIYQENGGTSAAAPLTAGIMALVLQKTQTAQGLANPVFYQLAAKQNTAACNSQTVKAGNACIFYDTTVGTNSQVCIPGDTNCQQANSGDQVGELTGFAAGTGYDMSTGLGSFNVTNLVNAWPTSGGGSTTSVSVSPTSYTFPSTTVGATSSTKATVTVKNTGTAALAISSVKIGGTNASSFFETTNCPTSLASGASCTVTVSFKPAAAGSLSGTLSVADGAGTQNVALAGTGAGSTASVSVGPSSLTFGSTTVGATSAAQTVTVKNTGTAALSISSVKIGGTNASSFLDTTNCSTSLAAGASCTVSVSFKPAAAGSLSGTLSVTDGAGTQNVTLAGTGAGSAASVAVGPTKLTFASTTVGATSAAQTVTVKNTGSAAVSVTSVKISGTNASSFLDTTNCPVGKTLAAGASCTVSVSFKPVAAGSLSGTLSVTDGAGTQNVALAGTGAGSTASVAVGPSKLAFASTKVGTTSAAQTVTVKNTGTAALSMTSVKISGSNGSSFLDSTNCPVGKTLAAGASCTVSVSFKPVAAGSLSGTLSVTDGAGTQNVLLSGTGAS